MRRCIITIAAARETTPDAIVLLEQRLDFSDWVPEGFGTGDLVVIGNGRCTVRDLKFGRGVRVDAEDNTQLMLYALGAIAAYRGIYDFNEVVVEIDQPRLNHVDGGDNILQVADLLRWAEEYVKPRAARAWAGEGDFAPGEHCRFCRARNACKARTAHLQDAVDVCYDEPDPSKPTFARLTDAELISLYPKLDQVMKWASGLKEFILNQAVGGKAWPGYKLVAGRSNRTVTDPEGLANVLMVEGIAEALIYEPPQPRALLGLSELERIVGKKTFAELAAGFIEKPPGKPTLVPADDKREALIIQSVEDQFA